MKNYNNKNKSIFLTILESLYLAIISSFKTLSSNTTTLFITFLIVFIVIYILSLRILVLPCFNCSKGSWWYKCAPDTGYGTKTCEWYDDIIKKAEDYVTYALRFKYNMYNRTFSQLKMVHEMQNQLMVWFDDMFYAILNLNPITAFMLFVYNAVIPPMLKAFANLFIEIDEANIGFVLPVINVELDIGAIIIAALKGILWFITFLFTLFIDIMFILAKGIYEYIFKPLFSALIFSIGNFFKTIAWLFAGIGIRFDKVINVCKIPFIFLGSLGIQDFIMLIFEAIIKAVLSIFSIGEQFIEIFPTIIVIGVILYILCFIIVPLVGACVCVGRLIKAIFYLLLSCDDDEDFRLIFVSVLNSIFKTNI